MKVWLCVLGLMVAPATAQIPEEMELPVEPSGCVLDDARLFSLEPERLDALSKQVAAVSERTGFEVKVAIFNTLIGVEREELAHALEVEWLTDGPGAVLLIESDGGQWDVAWVAPPVITAMDGGMMPQLLDNDLPQTDRVLLENRMQDLPPMETGSLDGAERLVTTFLDGIEASIIRPNERAEQGDPIRLIVLGIGLLAAFALATLLLVTLLRRFDRQVKERFVFPDVRVGMRLGAPFGGGKISSRSFAPSGGDEDG